MVQNNLRTAWYTECARQNKEKKQLKIIKHSKISTLKTLSAVNSCHPHTGTNTLT